MKILHLALVLAGLCGGFPATAQSSQDRPFEPQNFAHLGARIERAYAVEPDRAMLENALIQKSRALELDRPRFDQCLDEADENPAFRESLAGITGAVWNCVSRASSSEDHALYAHDLTQALLEALGQGNELIGPESLDALSAQAPGERARECCALSVTDDRIVLRIANGYGQLPTQEWRKVIENYRPARAVVLDLRDDTGGALPELAELADLFLSSGIIVETVGRSPRENARYSARLPDATNGLPIVVLVSERTTQGGEILAASLQDNGRARILGVQTSGQSLIRSVYPIGRHYAFTLVTAVTRRPSGQVIAGNGVTPDCRIDPARADLVDWAVRYAKGEVLCPLD
ncbi:S41 family peptidase [Erythrobacter dokdonensis]|nr:S41 family peptidase [Erythrobacter dokdonensis]